MLEVRDETPDRQVIVLASRTEGYRGWLLIAQVLLVVYVGMHFLSILGNAVIQHEVRFYDVITVLGLGGVVVVIGRWMRGQPVTERRLVLEPGRATLIHEVLSRPLYEVLNQQAQHFEITPDSGLLLERSVNEIHSVQLWNETTQLTVDSLGEEEMKQFGTLVSKWFHEQQQRLTNRLSDSTSKPIDAVLRDAQTLLADAKYVDVDFNSNLYRPLTIAIRPGSIHPTVVSHFILFVGSLVGAIGALSYFEIPGWPVVTMITAVGLLVITTLLRPRFESCSLEISDTEIVIRRRLFGRTSAQRFVIDDELEVGLVVYSRFTKTMLPAVCIRGSTGKAQFGVYLPQRDQQQLVIVLRAILKRYRVQNLFLDA